MFFIPVYILILVFTIIVDYYAGIFIERSKGKKRKRWLLASIIANVGILGVFKYYNFFIDNVNLLFHLPVKDQLPFLQIILPIGLSFHTFQAMSYTIEVYRGNQAAEKHFGIYALYVLFYPQLVAGPIERPQNLLWQFKVEHKFDIQRVYEGLKLILWGLFKKVVIADRLSIYVNDVYNNPASWPGSNLVVATIFFAIQIYCDFSGYSDMALGSAKVMGFKLMTNFNRPYFAKNIQDFWKRWHISLSSWFRDYVYISLGGNRVSKTRMYFNVAVVFLLSGLWHGANWTFAIWGFIHASLVIIYLLYREVRKKIYRDHWFIDLLCILMTFLVVCFGWIFFRASNIFEALTIIKKMAGISLSDFRLYYGAGEPKFGITSAVVSFIMILILFATEIFQNVQQTSLNKKPFFDIAFNGTILFLIIAFGVFQKTSFIYFQF